MALYRVVQGYTGLYGCEPLIKVTAMSCYQLLSCQGLVCRGHVHGVPPPLEVRIHVVPLHHLLNECAAMAISRTWPAVASPACVKRPLSTSAKSQHMLFSRWCNGETGPQ